MAKKSKRPSWFKLWLHHRPLLDAVPDEVAGRAVKAALNYFATGEVVQLGQLEMVLFSALKCDIDEASADYIRDMENGKKGGRPKKGKEEKPPVRGANPLQPTVTEGERDGDGDGEKRKGADKPPTCSGFSPPTVEEVRTYCQEKGYHIAPEVFVDFYQAKGWRIGKEKMKCWKSAVRTWERREQEKRNGSENHGGTIDLGYGGTECSL